MKTLIVSDIHIGSIRSNATYLLDLLEKEWINCKTIILAGDVFDDLNFKRISKEQWKLLSFLRGKSNDVEIVWIHGNHDEEAMNVASHFLGIPIVEKYEFIENGISFLVTHGHSLNPFFKFNSKIEMFINKLYSFIEQFDRKGKIAKWVENNQREDTKKYALNYSRFVPHDWIICGHSHLPEVQRPYANCGAWINELKTYITIDNQGNLKLNSL